MEGAELDLEGGAGRPAAGSRISVLLPVPLAGAWRGPMVPATGRATGS